MSGRDVPRAGDRGPDRRALLRGGAAAGVGLSTLTLPTAAQASSPVFTTGLGETSLVMYLDAANASSWTGTGAGTWRDLTAYGHSIPVGGSEQPTYATSDLGITGDTGAFVFDGSSGVTTTTPLPAFAYGTAWTLAVWVRFSDLEGDGWQTIVAQGDDRAGDLSNQLYFQKSLHTLPPNQPAAYGIPRSANQLGVALERGADANLFCFASTTVTVGTWYHFVATGTATTVAVYLDGEQAATTSNVGAYAGSLQPLGDGTVQTRIADAAVHSGNRLRGALAFLQVWTRALNAAEVRAQYAATRAPYHPLT